MRYKFKLTINKDDNFIDTERYKSIGLKMFEKYKNDTTESFHNWINTKKQDGDMISKEWFPIDDYDVFISHSHKDEDLALALSGWLYEKHGIKAFVDSCVWGYSNDLLKELDKKYSLNKDNKTYDYETRNITTAHVHMMLMIALSKTMDKSEAIFFLNTPNSIHVDFSTKKEKTFSPWIYGELQMANLLQNDYLVHLEYQQKVSISYLADTEGFIPISDDDLKNWDNSNIDYYCTGLEGLYLLVNKRGDKYGYESK